MRKLPLNGFDKFQIRNNAALCAECWNPQRQCGCLVSGGIFYKTMQPSFSQALGVFLSMCWFSTIVLSGDWMAVSNFFHLNTNPNFLFFFFFSIVGRQLGLSFAENLEVLLSLTSLLCPLAFFPHLFCWFSPASKDKPTSCVPKSFSVLLL